MSHSVPTPAVLFDPQVRLIGLVDDALCRDFLEQLKQVPEEDEVIAVEITTHGGDADIARRMALEIAIVRARRRARPLFVGKSYVHSAGVTLMGAFPREDRFLSHDAILLIHGRHLDRTVTISGPLRGSLPELWELTEAVKLGIALEEEGFRSLIEGSDVEFDEIVRRSRHNWYLRAGEALERGLVGALI